MKTYSKLYLKIYFIMSLISLVIAFAVLRRTDYQYPFIRIQLGLVLISFIVTLTFWLFKLEKGHSLLNIIIGYIVLIPAIFLLRTVYGNYLFRFTWIIYIIVVVVGIIYGVAVYVVSKKYKKEVNELNELLNNDNKKE
ncbi:MAG: hypothetical protein V3569_00390 [Acholeplasmataceae bacterium]|nr:DUF3021 family protein [Acholeplasmataceae bacterium]